jgi:general stress protein 26
MRWCNKLAQGNRAFATFAAKDHDLFATLHGSLSIDTDRTMIDRLWNRFIEA